MFFLQTYYFIYFIIIRTTSYFAENVIGRYFEGKKNRFYITFTALFRYFTVLDLFETIKPKIANYH